MIQYFWESTTILAAATAALLGASWKLFSNLDDNRKTYRSDSDSLRAILISNELLPLLVAFSTQLDQVKQSDPSGGIEKVLERQESSRSIKQVVQVTRKIVEIERIVEMIIENCNRCGYDFLLLSSIPIVGIVLNFFDAPIILYYAVAIILAAFLLKSISDFVKYRKGIRRLITKDSEIRENW